MLLRSFTVLLLLSLVGLGMILGYAFLNRTGVPAALASAQQYLEDNEPGLAIQVLDRIDRETGPKGNRAQREQMYDLRYRAHERIQSFRKAVHDLDALLRSSDEQRRVRYGREKLRILIRAANLEKGPEDASEQALGLATRLLGKTPGDPLTLSYAGRAEMVAFRLRLHRFLREDLANVIPASTRPKCRRALKRFLYLDDGDCQLADRQKAFWAMVEQEASAGSTTNRIRERVAALRAHVVSARRYFEAVLASEQVIPEAMLGYADLLLAAGEHEKAGFLTLLYLERDPDVRWASELALRAMQGLSVHDNPELALSVVDVWLGGRDPEHLAAAIRSRAEATWISPEAAQAFVELASLQHRLDDVDGLTELSQVLAEVEKDGASSLTMWLPFVDGLLADSRQSSEEVETELARFCRNERLEPEPWVGRDFLVEAFRLRVVNARAANDLKTARAVLATWARKRPHDPTPLQMRIDLELAAGDQLATAVQSCRQLLLVGDDDESRQDALDKLLAAYDAIHASDGKDSMSIIRELHRNRQLAPVQPVDPIVCLGIARLASEANAHDVVIANATRVLDEWPWSRAARELLARSYLAKQEYTKALRETAELLERFPNRGTVLELRRLALSAHDPKSSELPDLEQKVLQNDPTSPYAADLFARKLIARKDYRKVLVLSERSACAAKDPARLYWAKGIALLESSRVAAGVGALLRVPRDSDEREPALLRALDASLEFGLNTRVAEAVDGLLHSSASSDSLMRAARALAARGRHDDALRVLASFEDDPDRLRRARNGRYFTLQGSILLAKGNDAGLVSLQRAFSFRDGNAAGTLLYLYYLLHDRKQEAEEIRAQLGSLEGRPLTLFYVFTREGEVAKALAELDRAAVASPRLKMLLRALVRPESSDTIPYPPLKKLVDDHRDLLLDALALCPSIAFAPRARAAMDKLRSITLTPGRKPILQAAYPWLELLEAYREELAGKPHPASSRLLNLVQGHVIFLPAYEELFRLLDDEGRQLLVTPDMLARYMHVIGAFGAGAIVRYSDPRMFDYLIQGQSRLLLQMNKPVESSALLAWAHRAFGLLDLEMDPAAVDLLIRDAIQRSDWKRALDLQLEVLDSTADAAERRERLRVAFTRAMRADELHDPKLEPELEELTKRAQRYHSVPTSIDHPPLAAATLLAIRRQTKSMSEADAKARAKDMLLAYLRPYLDGSLPVTDDLGGLLDVLAELHAHDLDDEADDAVDRLLLRDPTLIRLWLRKARRLAARGEIDAALASLEWIPDLLPDRDVYTEIAILAAEHARGDRERYTQLARQLATADTARALSARALLAYRLGRLDEASELFAKVSEPEPGVEFYAVLTALARHEAEDEDRDAIRHRLNGIEGPYAPVARTLATQLE